MEILFYNTLNRTADAFLPLAASSNILLSEKPKLAPVLIKLLNFSKISPKIGFRIVLYTKGKTLACVRNIIKGDNK